MNIVFEKMGETHRKEIISIFNYYIQNGTAAFRSDIRPESYYDELLETSKGYPSYALKDDEKGCVVGFCLLRPYSPNPTFKEAACITYFISDEYTGKGLGGQCLSRLEKEARDMGVSELIAEISSENRGSIEFHKKNGFSYVGELTNIGKKFGRTFGVVLMQKGIFRAQK